MNKKIWFAAGVAGMLLGNPAADTKAEININIGLGGHPPFALSTRPEFILLPNFGFAVAVGSGHDIIFYENNYYAFQNGIWYGSRDYRGTWDVVHESRLPYEIRRHRWQEIRMARDVEYRRHDRRYDGRYDWKNNRGQRPDGNNRDRDNRGQREDNRNRNNQGNDNRRDEGGRRN
jgi:hypothetical protein